MVVLKTLFSKTLKFLLKIAFFSFHQFQIWNTGSIVSFWEQIIVAWRMIHFTNFGWPWCYPRSRFETFDDHYDRNKDQGYPNHPLLEFWVWILEVKVNFILDGLGIPVEKNEIYRHQNHSSSIKWFEILVIFVFQELFCYFLFVLWCEWVKRGKKY